MTGRFIFLIRREKSEAIKVPFEKGMDETIRWYVRNESWWKSLLGRRPEKEDQWGKV